MGQLLFDKNFPRWITLLSTKKDGPMPLSRDVNTSPFTKNRQKFLKENGIGLDQIVTAQLSHGTNIVQVQAGDGGKIFANTDGLSTNIPGTFLTVTVADCIPLYFFDPNKKVVAITHAGWRGLAENIPGTTVGHLQEHYQSLLEDLFVGLGPSIGPCHYEIGSAVVKQFDHFTDAVTMRAEKIFLDLRLVCKQQLYAAGITPHHIEVDPRCTFEDNQLFSSRRNGGVQAGVMMAIAGMQK